MADETLSLLNQKRDNFRIEIRKQRTEKIYQQKRMMYLQKNTEGIKEEQINGWYQRLVNNQDIISVLQEIISLFQANQCTEYNIVQFNKHELYSYLINLWIISGLDYEITQRLIYIFQTLHSFTYFDDLAFIENKQVMSKLLSLLELPNHQEIQRNIFLLLGNLVGYDNGAKVRALADYDVAKKLKNMWLNQLIYLEKTNIQEFCWFLSNFVSYRRSNIARLTTKELRELLPILQECLRFEDNNTKIYVLQAIQGLLESSSDLYQDIILKLELFKDIIVLERSTENEEIIMKAILIITGVSECDNEELLLNLLQTQKILDYFNILYIAPGRQTIQRKIKQLIAFALSNFVCCNTFEILQILVNHNLLLLIQQDVELIQEEVLLLFRNLSLIKNVDLLKFVFMRGNMVQIIIEILKTRKEKNIILICLNTIYNFAITIASVAHNNINLVVEQFMSNGFQEILGKLEFSEDKEIYENVIKLHEEFFVF